MKWVLSLMHKSDVLISRVTLCMANMKSTMVHKSQRQFVKYIIIGALSTTLDIGTYIILSRYVSFFSSHYIGAKGVAFTIGSLSSYINNRRWTFNQPSRAHFKEVFRFYSVAGVGIIINMSSFYFLLQKVHIYDLLGVIIATSMSFVWNFTMSKYFVFTNKSDSHYVP